MEFNMDNTQHIMEKVLQFGSFQVSTKELARKIVNHAALLGHDFIIAKGNGSFWVILR